MNNTIEKQSQSYMARRKRWHNWQKLVMALSSIVVFCTTYVLILPAITATRTDPHCGVEEHQHTEACYTWILVDEEETGLGLDPSAPVQEEETEDIGIVFLDEDDKGVVIGALSMYEQDNGFSFESVNGLEDETPAEETLFWDEPENEPTPTPTPVVEEIVTAPAEEETVPEVTEEEITAEPTPAPAEESQETEQPEQSEQVTESEIETTPTPAPTAETDTVPPPPHMRTARPHRATAIPIRRY